MLASNHSTAALFSGPHRISRKTKMEKCAEEIRWAILRAHESTGAQRVAHFPRDK